MVKIPKHLEVLGFDWREGLFSDKTFVAFSFLASAERPFLLNTLSWPALEATTRIHKPAELSPEALKVLYLKESKQLIQEALKTPPNSLVVVFDRESPDNIRAWGLFDTSADQIIYVYTKLGARRFGIATALIQLLKKAPTPDDCQILTERGLLLLDSIGLK